MEPRTTLKVGDQAQDRLEEGEALGASAVASQVLEDLLRAGQRLPAQAGGLRRAIRHDGRTSGP